MLGSHQECIVLGVSWTNLEQLRREILVPSVWGLLDDLWLFEGVLLAQMRYFHLN